MPNKITLYDEERSDNNLIVDVDILVEGDITNGDWELFRQKDLANRQYPEYKIINVICTREIIPAWLGSIIAYWFGFQINNNYSAVAINGVVAFSFSHNFETGYKLY